MHRVWKSIKRCSNTSALAQQGVWHSACAAYGFVPASVVLHVYGRVVQESCEETQETLTALQNFSCTSHSDRACTVFLGCRISSC